MASADTAPIVGALITACVALIVAVAGTVMGYLRLRADRAYARRVAALTDLQDRSLVLRNATRRYGQALQSAAETVGPVGATAPSPARPSSAAESRAARAKAVESAEGALFRATGGVEIAASRVDDPAVTRLHSAWVSNANVYFLDPDEVSASQENDAWRAFIAAVSAALRSSSGRLKR